MPSYKIMRSCNALSSIKITRSLSVLSSIKIMSLVVCYQRSRWGCPIMYYPKCLRCPCLVVYYSSVRDVEIQLDIMTSR